MKQILFYAVREDLLTLLEFAEAQGQLKYTPMGNFFRSTIEPSITIFKIGSEIPSLGTASANSSAACDSFLVYEGDTVVNLRSAGSTGERVCVDQLINPDSVEFRPSGLWDESIIIQGRIATASQSQPSQALMKRFNASIKRAFTKVGSCYVGTNALALQRDGTRLTIAVQSPPEYDLVLPSAGD